jgi:hypothetical protein
LLIRRDIFPSLSLNFEPEAPGESHFVILSGAKDLAFSRSYEILWSLRSLRMTDEGTFPEVSTLNGELLKAAVGGKPGLSGLPGHD